MNIKTYKLPNGKKAVFEYDVCGIGKVTLECMDELMGMIAEAPTIDIVRCKECKYWRTRDDGTNCCAREYATDHWCADDFCSYGDKRDD